MFFKGRRFKAATELCLERAYKRLRYAENEEINAGLCWRDLGCELGGKVCDQMWERQQDLWCLISKLDKRLSAK